jgi:hypothetical protein
MAANIVVITRGLYPSMHEANKRERALGGVCDCTLPFSGSWIVNPAINLSTVVMWIIKVDITPAD